MSNPIGRLLEASKVLRSKQGVGKRQKTSIVIELEMDAGIDETTLALMRLAFILQGSKVVFDSEVLDVKVDSEHFSNPDAPWAGVEK